RVAPPVRHGQGPQRHRELDVHRRPVPRGGRAAPTRIQYAHGRHRTRRRRVPARPRHRPSRTAAVARRLLCAAAPGRTGAGGDAPVPDHHTAEERSERRRTRTHRTRDLGGAVNDPTMPADREHADANASSGTQTLTTAEAGARNGFLRWFMPELPLARVAVFRVFIYIFIIIDVLTISGDVIAHGWTPEFYQPLWLARALHIPAVSVLGAQILLAVIIVSSLLAAAGVVQRLSGWAAALSFGAWMFYTQGYGYVAHDHMALVIAAFVLPTVGAARFRDVEATSARAGWALRVVQISVVLTYFYSVLMKWIASGNIAHWGNGAVIIWALMRRGAEWSKPFLEMPG